MTIVALVVLGWLNPAGAAENWLTPTEVKFFESFGRDVIVGAKGYRTKADLSRLNKLSLEAETPLKESLERFLKARNRMLLNRDDLYQYFQARQNAQEELGRQFGVAMIMMFLGESPWGAAVGTTEGMLNSKALARVWDLQEQWLIRGIEGLGEADAAVESITDELEKRLGPRVEDTLGLRLDYSNHRLRIVGEAGSTPLTQPVFQFVAHKTPIDGQLGVQSAVSLVLLQGMGVERLDCEAAYQMGKLARLKEIAVGRPIVMTQSMPSLKAWDKFSIQPGLPPGEIYSVGRAEIRFWSRDRWFRIADLPGLDEVKTKARIDAEKERSERIKKYRENQIKRARNEINDAVSDMIKASEGQEIRRGQYQNSLHQQRAFESFQNRLRNGLP